MHHRQLASVLVGSLAVCVLLSGCGEGIKKEADQKPTFKVTGSVAIDGNIPDPPVLLVCHAKNASGGALEKSPSCTSKPDGTFEFITYRDGDGAPAGDYAVTVEWKEYDVIKREYKAADKLKGRYSDPKKTEIELKVENKPVNMGTLELTTK